MNTKPITAISTPIRAAALAGCLAALFAGATACGAEHGATGSGGRPPALSSAELIESAKSNQAIYLERLRAQAEAAQQLRAERADAARWAQGHSGDQAHGYGDDRRQPSSQPSDPAPRIHRDR